MGAKGVESSVEDTLQLLGQSSPAIAILSSAFPAAYDGIQPGQLVTALKKLGFSEVMEVAFGADLVGREYHRLVMEENTRTTIFTSCPSVVEYIRRFYPELISQMAPVVSPMIAMGRVIKRQYAPEAKVVFIGPCISKKVEAEDEDVTDTIDAILTFDQLNELLDDEGIDLADQELGQFSGPKPHMGRMYCVPGGWLKAAGLPADIMKSNVITAQGPEQVVEIIREVAQGSLETRFLELFFCNGCVGGPNIGNDLGFFKRKELVTSYTLSEADSAQTERDIAEYAHIDLSRTYTPWFTLLNVPTEEEINARLVQINRAKPEDQINCGACGYASCRELATAVCQGLGEIEMCWPYLLESLEASQETQLSQAQRLASMGELAASVAHEINNPLAGVFVYLKLLSKKLGNDTISKEATLKYLSRIQSEISRSSTIVRNFLNYSRQTELAIRPVDVNQVIEQSLSLVGHKAELQNIHIVEELSASLPKTMADFDQLQQVLTNLCLNAIHAMPDGGTLVLRTSMADGDQGEIRIDVQDTGCGIAEEDLPKLFTPFFTTKEKGIGVGLGLAVAHGIIERHKGKIMVESWVGEGTCFTICLGTQNE